MSYPINKNINPYQQQQTTMGVNNNPQLNLQNVDPNAVSQNVVNNSVLKGVSDSSSDGLFSTKTFLISLPVWVAMCFGVDKFGKACAGNNSLLHKAARLGDKIANKFKPLETMVTKIGDFVTHFKNDIAVPKRKFLYSLFHTPAEAENMMAKPMASGPLGEVASDVVNKLKMHLECKGELELDKIPEFKDLSNEDYLTKLAERSHTKDGIEEVLKICKKNKEKEVLQITKGIAIPLSEKFSPNQKPIYLTDYIKNESLRKKIIGEHKLSEYINKMEALKSVELIKGGSRIGRVLSRALLRLEGGLAQSMSSSKLGLLMGAYFIAESIKKGIEAPKGNGEKRKTFTENFMYNFGFMLTMPLAAKMMYGVGGMKYIGMTKEQVEAYRTELKALNERVKNNAITKTEYQDIVKNKLRPMLKGDLKGAKGLLYKPFKLFGRLWDIGLENRRPFTGEGANIIQKTLGRLPHTFRRTSGFFLRFALFNFVFSQILAKLFAQGSDAIFGKPSKSILDEGKEEKKNGKNSVQPLIIPQQDAVIPQMQQAAIQPMQQNNILANNQFVTPENKENIIGTAMQKNVVGSPTTSKRYIPSEDAVKIEKQVDLNEEKKKKYEKAKTRFDSIANSVSKM